jgi:hypothetical protein
MTNFVLFLGLIYFVSYSKGKEGKGKSKNKIVAVRKMYPALN